ncbi:unnamed protein product [Toxocara canis]|uniref:Aminoglycoside phosphotransferase n=1 Tax=Toxocara canis TaxID=6265 RepID=A0A183UT10_TOXCA|nr:unnamed protein product [Toxocara canis]
MGKRMENTVERKMGIDMLASIEIELTKRFGIVPFEMRYQAGMMMFLGTVERSHNFALVNIPATSDTVRQTGTMVQQIHTIVTTDKVSVPSAI